MSTRTVQAIILTLLFLGTSCSSNARGTATSSTTPLGFVTASSLPTNAAITSPAPGTVLPLELPVASVTPPLVEPTPPLGINTLSTSRPWLLFEKAGRVWLADPKGGLKDVAPAMPWGARPSLVSHSGRYLAVIGKEGEVPRLAITSIPDGSLRCATDLVKPSYAADASNDAWKVIWSADSFAWSPAGDVLAMAAALDAPTTDLYLLDPSTCEPQRLTSGELDAYNLHWSPDGRYIVHAAGFLGTGAGDFVKALWASASDASGNKYLYPGPDADESRHRDRTGGEYVWGWLTPTTFLVTSWDVSWGDRDLRAFDIEAGESTHIWPDRINRLAFDPISRVVLLSNPWPSDPPFFPEEPGLFLIRPGRSPSLLGEVPFSSRPIVWYKEPGLFTAETTEGPVTVSPDGAIQPLRPPSTDCAYAAPSPDGRYWAWPCSDGLWISGEAVQKRIVTALTVESVSWSPDASTLLYLANDRAQTLFRYNLEGSTTNAIVSGLSDTSPYPPPPEWIR